jgi:hypothetical protein
MQNKIRDNLSLVTCVLLIFISLTLWIVSTVQARSQLVSSGMGNLGLFSLMPFPFFVSFALLIISFFISLKFVDKQRNLILLSQTLLFIVFLNLPQVIIEGTARITTSYTNFISVDYILQTGQINPSSNWALNWPSFSILIGIFAQITSIPAQTILLYYPLVFNLLLLPVLYIFFVSFKKNSNLVWFAIWFVYLGFWTSHDYFRMQSLAFLVTILKFFLLIKTVTVKALNRKWLTLFYLLFFYVVSSHLLTSIVVIFVLILLFLSKQLNRSLLVCSSALLIIGWAIFDAYTYLTVNLKAILSQFLDLQLIFQSNFQARLSSGSAFHVMVTQIRVIYSGIMVLIAISGLFLLWKNKKIGKFEKILLVFLFAPLPFLVTFSYGGELIQRIFTFSLIPLAYFSYKSLKRKPLLVAVLIFFVAFAPSLNMVAHYGNETLDRVPISETTGVQFLYSATSAGNVIGGASLTGDARDLSYHENYNYVSFRSISERYNSSEPFSWGALWGSHLWSNPNDLANQRYLIISYSTEQYIQFLVGMPEFVNEVEGNLTQSVSFNLLYSNPSFKLFNSPPT